MKRLLMAATAALARRCGRELECAQGAGVVAEQLSSQVDGVAAGRDRELDVVTKTPSDVPKSASSASWNRRRSIAMVTSISA